MVNLALEPSANGRFGRILAQSGGDFYDDGRTAGRTGGTQALKGVEEIITAMNRSLDSRFGDEALNEQCATTPG